jgi:tryptophan-rich sensory protein
MGRFFKTLALVGAGTAAATILSQRIAGRDVRQTYESLAKPPWAPHPGVFAPVWIALYGLLVVSTTLVVAQDDNPARNRQIALYVAQLGANTLWTPLFFRWKRKSAAEIDAVLLTLLVASLAVSYAPRSRSAAVMLLPVVAWCGFATVLTHEVRF